MKTTALKIEKALALLLAASMALPAFGAGLTESSGEKSSSVEALSLGGQMGEFGLGSGDAASAEAGLKTGVQLGLDQTNLDVPADLAAEAAAFADRSAVLGGSSETEGKPLAAEDLGAEDLDKPIPGAASLDASKKIARMRRMIKVVQMSWAKGLDEAQPIQSPKRLAGLPIRRHHLKPLGAFGGLQEGVLSQALSPDQKYVLKGGYDGVARLSKTSDGQEVLSVGNSSRGGAGAPVSSVAFHRNGRSFFMGSYDGAIRQVFIKSGRVRTFKVDGPVLSMEPSRDGKSLYVGGGKNIEKLELKTQDLSVSFGGHEDVVRPMVESADGKFLYSAGTGQDKTVRKWDAASAREIWSVGIEGSSLVESADGRDLFVGDMNGFVHQVDAASGAEVARIKVFDEGGVRSLLRGEGRFLVVLGADAKPVRLNLKSRRTKPS